jgi:Tol biopolymer transport system component
MNESMDRALADWLREGPGHGSREALERALAATRRTSQRPEWTFPERWLPMQLTMARTPSMRPILYLGLVALLIATLAAAALLVGSQNRLPEPFGLARNGVVVFEQDSDLLIADGLDSPTRTLIGGPDADAFPLFSRQGDRLAFVRDADEGGFQLMSVRPDGSDVRVLGTFPGENAGVTWSPDGSALLVTFTETDHTAFRLAAVQADGSGSRELFLGRVADWASWRPDGRHVAFRGALGDGTSGAFIGDADGTNVRRLPIETTDLVDFEGLSWTPDGTRLSFMSAGSLAGTGMSWQIGIATIDASGALADLEWLKLDPESRAELYPTWSPDGSQFAFILEKAGRRQLAIASSVGRGAVRPVGPQSDARAALWPTWSPDGQTLAVAVHPSSGDPTFWSIDVASGEATQLQGSKADTWQRLAP